MLALALAVGLSSAAGPAAAQETVETCRAVACFNRLIDTFNARMQEFNQRMQAYNARVKQLTEEKALLDREEAQFNAERERLVRLERRLSGPSL